MIPLRRDEIVYLTGKKGTIGIIKVAERSPLFIDTDSEEFALFLEPDDLLVASGFGVGSVIRQALRCVLFNIREVGSPLIVLPRNHPGSKRLKFVLSAGSKVVVQCEITPGTHPEQDVVCGVDEFSGIRINATPGGFELTPMIKDLKREAF
ncbi:MAG TPA: hypothetical protein ENL17_02145 [Candidatus Methanoperedenaceae archaeon]|nr:hypothetical protein [Candidatus Methanoperedenaceae archaeon]